MDDSPESKAQLMYRLRDLIIDTFEEARASGAFPPLPESFMESITAALNSAIEIEVQKLDARHDAWRLN